MLKTRAILSIITLGLIVYTKITENYNFTSYMFLLLGLIILLGGIRELQKDRKNFWGYIGIIASLFVFFVSIQGFLIK